MERLTFWGLVTAVISAIVAAIYVFLVTRPVILAMVPDGSGKFLVVAAFQLIIICMYAYIAYTVVLGAVGSIQMIDHHFGIDIAAFYWKLRRLKNAKDYVPLESFQKGIFMLTMLEHHASTKGIVKKLHQAPPIRFAFMPYDDMVALGSHKLRPNGRRPSHVHKADVAKVEAAMAAFHDDIRQDSLRKRGLAA